MGFPVGRFVDCSRVSHPCVGVSEQDGPSGSVDHPHGTTEKKGRRVGWRFGNADKSAEIDHSPPFFTSNSSSGGWSGG